MNLRDKELHCNNLLQMVIMIFTLILFSIQNSRKHALGDLKRHD